MMTFTEAKQLFMDRRVERKPRSDDDPYVFPYSTKHVGDMFIGVQIPLQHIKSMPTNEQTVNKYKLMIEQGENFDPVWLSFGKRLDNGSVNQHYHQHLEPRDGNHRVEAHIRAGEVMIFAIMPNSHHQAYVERENG